MITPPDSKNKLTVYKPYHLFLKEKKKSKHFFVGKGYFKWKGWWCVQKRKRKRTFLFSFLLVWSWFYLFTKILINRFKKKL